MSRPLVVVEHLPHEPAGVLAEVCAADGIEVATARLHAGDQLPAAADIAALVVLGGDMCTDETDAYPFLVDEVALLGEAVAAGIPVLGLCLGAQLLAEATGGRITHGVPEIGYIPVARTPAGVADPLFSAFADGTPTFNAHQDQIAVGPGAVVLASSANTPVHGFRVGSAYGVQFHPEIDGDMVAGYVAAPGVAEYLRGGGWEPSALVAEARRHDPAHRMAGAALLRRWLHLAAVATPAPTA